MSRLYDIKAVLARSKEYKAQTHGGNSKLVNSDAQLTVLTRKLGNSGQATGPQYSSSLQLDYHPFEWLIQVGLCGTRPRLR